MMNDRSVNPYGKHDQYSVISVGPDSAFAADVTAWNEVRQLKEYRLGQPDSATLAAEQEALDRAAWKSEVGGSNYLDNTVYLDITHCLTVYSRAYKALTDKRLYVGDYAMNGFAYISELPDALYQENESLFFLEAGAKNEQDALEENRILQESFRLVKRSVFSKLRGAEYIESMTHETDKQIAVLNSRKRSRILKDVDVLDAMMRYMSRELRPQYDLQWYDNGEYDRQFELFCNGVASLQDGSTWADKPPVSNKEAVEEDV